MRGGRRCYEDSCWLTYTTGALAVPDRKRLADSADALGYGAYSRSCGVVRLRLK